MVVRPGLVPLPADHDGTRLLNGDPIVVTLPVEGYENVARLVAGGLASRLEFGFEAVDDVQLAIELVLRSLPAREGCVSMTLSEDGRSLAIELSSVGELTLEQPLRALDGGGMALGASLERLVDSVELRSAPEPAIRLLKALPGQA